MSRKSQVWMFAHRLPPLVTLTFVMPETIEYPRQERWSLSFDITDYPRPDGRVDEIAMLDGPDLVQRLRDLANGIETELAKRSATVPPP